MKKHKKLGYTKILVTVITAVSILVLFYSMFEMHRQENLDSLSILLSGTVIETTGLAIAYIRKSTIENADSLTHSLELKKLKSNGCDGDIPEDSVESEE